MIRLGQYHLHASGLETFYSSELNPEFCVMKGRTAKSAVSDDKFIIDAINAFVEDTSAESTPYRAMVYDACVFINCLGLG